RRRPRFTLVPYTTLFRSTGQLNSIEGWAGASGTVKIQKAKTANVYKIVSPFGANSIAFMVKSDGKSIVFPNQIIDNHPTYGPVRSEEHTSELQSRENLVC